MDGKALRLGRLFKGIGEPLFTVPLDHSVTDGPFADCVEYQALLRALAANGADAIVIHKGRLAQIPEQVYAALSVVVHLSASTKYSVDPDHKYQVATLDDCLRRGADAISVHVNLGSATEAEQVSTLARVADDCDRRGVPLLAMIYPRGKGVEGHAPRMTLSHAASLAADLGADIVKLPLRGSLDDMRQIIESCPIPILAAGGKPTTDAEFDSFIVDVLQCGARGIAAGRNIFMASDPATRVRQISTLMRSDHSSPRARAA